MTFGREKRLWLGALAMLVPIPLPFNQVLEWPFLFVYCLFVIHFVQRAERGAWVTLDNWALNLLGLFYLPVFYFDLQAAFLRGTAVTALLHLILFLLVVKLYSIRRERDKWHIMVAIYFLFVGAMATSSHVSIAPYLLAFLVISLLVLGRFAHLHMMVGMESSSAMSLPFRAPLTLGTLLVLLVAVPLFATMPRIREPYILGRGTGSGGMARTTGFSDSVDLSLTSSIRGNRNVAMRVQYAVPERVGNSGDLRFKGATYERYRNDNWYRLMQQVDLLVPETTKNRGRFFDLGSGETPDHQATVFLEPLGSISLILPSEALNIETELQTTLGLDSGGAILIPVQPREPLKYTVGLASRPVIHARLDDDPESEISGLDPGGLTPQMIELAEQVMGGEEISAETRIDRLEQHMLTQYAYTLDYLGRSGENPLEDFLFVYKSGHCELFASAMVLMLRSQGIPARFVTGFLGAELNPLEGYYVIRQQNAHAWVEAYTESRGWRIYDPTPPDGRPSVAPQSLALLMSQVYDYFTFRWDRYVLTYGADDQESVFRRMRERLKAFWGSLRKRVDKEPTESPAPFAADTAEHEDIQSPWIWQPRWPLLFMLLVFATAVALLGVWNHRRPLSGAAAYLCLRTRLERAGLPVSDSLAPLELLARGVERFPPAADAMRHVVGHYVRESFAGRELADSERQELRQALRSVDEVLAEARRQARHVRGRRAPAPASA